MAPISRVWSAGRVIWWWEIKSHGLAGALFPPDRSARPHSKKGIFRLIFKLISLTPTLERGGDLILTKKRVCAVETKKLCLRRSWRDWITGKTVAFSFPPCPTLLAGIEICNFPFCGKARKHCLSCLCKQYFVRRAFAFAQQKNIVFSFFFFSQSTTF